MEGEGVQQELPERWEEPFRVKEERGEEEELQALTGVGEVEEEVGAGAEGVQLFFDCLGVGEGEALGHDVE